MKEQELAMIAYEQQEPNQRLGVEIETTLRLAERRGVRTAAAIIRCTSDNQNELTEVLAHNAMTRMHPASTIKVAIAIYLAQAKLAGLTSDQLADTHAVDWSDFEPKEFVPGGGVFDQPDAPRHASYLQLIQDMLTDAKSGNMAAKLLIGRSGAEAFNAFWASKGLASIRLKPKGDWYEIEHASAADLAKVVMMIPTLRASGASPQVSSYTELFMLGGSGTPGTVSGALERYSRTQLETKTGKLPPDDEDPFHSRHDIGILMSEAGESLVYAIMTQADTRGALYTAQQTIDQIGALMAHELGLQTPSRTRRILAMTALRASGVVKRFKS